MAAPSDPLLNHLLAALPPDVWQRWRPQLEPVELALGQVLYEPGVALRHAYFPTTAIVSRLYVTHSGATAEVAVIGREGVVGIALFMGGVTTPHRAVVRAAGQAYRLDAEVIKSEFERSLAVKRLLLRYTQAVITQMAQMVVCNRRHRLDQQLCRWLLMSLDRKTGDELLVTHELIADMLGVRREGVTEAALGLQKAGLIQGGRGHMKILDRAGLEHRACECYAVVKGEYDRLLPGAGTGRPAG